MSYRETYGVVTESGVVRTVTVAFASEGACDLSEIDLCDDYREKIQLWLDKHYSGEKIAADGSNATVLNIIMFCGFLLAVILSAVVTEGSGPTALNMIILGGFLFAMLILVERLASENYHIKLSGAPADNDDVIDMTAVA